MYITGVTIPSDNILKAWVRLLRAQQKTLAEVEAALKQGGFPPLVWYDVLLELDRAGDNGLRPFELEDAMLMPQYGVSRLIDRIEKKGLLMREICEDDRRGFRLVLTPAGRELRNRMWPTYAHAINNALGSRLTARQASTLAQLLGKLAG